MAEHHRNFIDHVILFARSGKGGEGSVHFRREAFVPKGGPDGGDGGRGGHIIVKGNKQLWTLLHLRYRKNVIAKKGEPGGGGCKAGKKGKDEVLEVPLGTVIKDADSEKVLYEITENDQQQILLPGGEGGKGNVHFKNATNQAPRYAHPGGESQEKRFVFELKILADVGLVGFPNAGKSTLLSVLSAAKPAVADYPFTTINPNLGVVPYGDYQSFVMADIPGIIEGASQGRGLGARFLRHIERNAILLFLIPADSNNIVNEFNILLKELETHNPELLDKNRILAISKADLLDEELKEELNAELKNEINFVFISSVSEQGLDNLKNQIWDELKRE